MILLSGIPATGKTSFARYLALKRGFAHYDLERHPGGWPCPDLKSKWDANRAAFVSAVRNCHNRIVLDWGFPPCCYTWVKELRDCGVTLVWFEGDTDAARRTFTARDGTYTCSAFNTQINKVRSAGYPDALNCLVLPALSANAVFLDPREIESRIFGEI